MKKYELIKFNHNSIDLEVRFSKSDNTIWLSREEIGYLFNKSRPTISRQIKSIYERKILKKETTCAKNARMIDDQNRVYETELYNLEMIEELGRSIKSQITSIFLEWCSQTLHILNQKDSMKANKIRFEQENLTLDVEIVPEENTVYLSKDQLLVLFETSRQNLEYHIRNIYSSEELKKEATCKEILQVQIENEREVSRYIDLYNLDMIISIGFRINSKRGIAFRQWATKVLKEYLVKGYSLDDNRVLVTTENYIGLVNRVNNLDSRVNELEINQRHLFLDDKIIYDGQTFEALALINKIIQTANKEIVLIDPYVDVLTLEAFKNKQPEIQLTIITSSKNRLNQHEIDSFNKVHGKLSIDVDGSYHDRYLILDNEIFYHLGSSINYLGKRFSQITNVKDKDIIEVLRKRIANKIK